VCKKLLEAQTATMDAKLHRWIKAALHPDKAPESRREIATAYAQQFNAIQFELLDDDGKPIKQKGRPLSD
jgi:regulator of PEP synthase PpsR (kinase-PPPase family)